LFVSEHGALSAVRGLLAATLKGQLCVDQ